MLSYTTSFSDDDLLTVPIANLRPGELAHAFAVQARYSEKKLEEAARDEHQLADHRQNEAAQEEHEEAERREVMLLESIGQREMQIQQEARALDERAIKLDDGRRAYVDGNKFRDAEGRELTGADRAQAEVLHVDQPHAATWQEKQKIEQQWATVESARRDVESTQTGTTADTNASLAAADKKLQSLASGDKPQSGGLPDYGAGDYMHDLAAVAPKAIRPGL